jgi:hypothetical protein
MRDKSGKGRLREFILKSNLLVCMIDPNNIHMCILCSCMYIDLYERAFMQFMSP